MSHSPLIPDYYRDPEGLPLLWCEDVTGLLPDAVALALAGPGPAGWARMSEPQVRLVRDYLLYVLAAPCWVRRTREAEFAALDALTRAARSPAMLYSVIQMLPDVGIELF